MSHLTFGIKYWVAHYFAVIVNECLCVLHINHSCAWEKLSERDLRRIIGDIKKENARDSGTQKGDLECTRGGACVPNDSEGKGRDGGRMMGRRHEWKSRGAPREWKSGKICHRFIDSHHKEPNERTAGTSGWIWRVLAYALFRLPSHHLPLGWIPVSLLPCRSWLSFFFLPSRCLHLRASISAADAVIVRCSSRCIVVRNNDFIKIYAKGRRWHRREPVWWKGREGGRWRERVGKPGCDERPILREGGFSPGGFFDDEENRVAVSAQNRFCHIHIYARARARTHAGTFSDVNFSLPTFFFILFYIY